jgi:hypothetical protein
VTLRLFDVWVERGFSRRSKNAGPSLISRAMSCSSWTDCGPSYGKVPPGLPGTEHRRRLPGLPQLEPYSAARSHHLRPVERGLLFVEVRQVRHGPVQQTCSDPGGVVRGERAALQCRGVRGSV